MRTQWLMVRLVLTWLSISSMLHADDQWPLFEYLRSDASMVGYTPSKLDPRNPANQGALKTSDIHADLETLRPYFDGLVLYGYHEANTPRLVAVARELKYRAVLLGIWDPKSAAEVDGAAALVEQFGDDLAIGVIVGNEGLTFGRYEEEDVRIAGERLRWRLGDDVPLTTSEPLVGYEREFVMQFGDFLAPNIHPVFDRPALNAGDAAAWVRAEALRLARDSGKLVLVKETGFPHAGRHDGTPEYSPDLQRAFWEAHLAEGRVIEAERDERVFVGVGFEAFDLPWKAEASGLPIEKSWGLFGQDRMAYPAAEVFRQE